MEEPKVTVHCVECGSQDIVEINAVNRWDVERQQWVATDSYEGYMYDCGDCGNEDSEYNEKESEKESKKMKDYAERASNYIGKHARYYARGIPPTGEKYAVEYRGAVFVSNDTYDLRLQLQAEMVKKGSE